MCDYEKRIQSAAEKIGHAPYRLEIDETAPGHMISHYAIEKVILPELRSP